ncbi:hypothetical protein H0H92_001193 [Tricholoma furcatifolium]|nr:hypothetical protein H0H92_001193 [Tricholoma furcatifolium]
MRDDLPVPELQQAPAPAKHDDSDSDHLPARVPYVLPPVGTNPIADAIRVIRGGTLLAVDGVLPLLASAVANLSAVINRDMDLPGDMRELAHEAVGRSEGLTTAQLRIIRLSPSSSVELLSAEATSTLGSQLSAMLAFTDWSTSTVRVPEPVFEQLRRFLNDQQLVEAAGVVVALDVDGKKDVPVPIPV